MLSALIKMLSCFVYEHAPCLSFIVNVLPMENDFESYEFSCIADPFTSLTEKTAVLLARRQRKQAVGIVVVRAQFQTKPTWYAGALANSYRSGTSRFKGGGMGN